MGMEKSNTREQILEAALDLFAVNGYEATSISQLADAVGIRKASLYSHFANKQDILDNVVETVLKGYADHSIFVRANWDDPEFTKDKTGMTAEDVAKLIQGQMRYILHDPHISKGRKLLMIEQFRNEELAELQTKQNYEDVLNYFEGMMRYLIRNNILKKAEKWYIPPVPLRKPKTKGRWKRFLRPTPGLSFYTKKRIIRIRTA